MCIRDSHRGLRARTGGGLRNGGSRRGRRRKGPRLLCRKFGTGRTRDEGGRSQRHREWNRLTTSAVRWRGWGTNVSVADENGSVASPYEEPNAGRFLACHGADEILDVACPKGGHVVHGLLARGAMAPAIFGRHSVPVLFARARDSKELEEWRLAHPSRIDHEWRKSRGASKSHGPFRMGHRRTPWNRPR